MFLRKRLSDLNPAQVANELDDGEDRNKHVRSVLGEGAAGGEVGAGDGGEGCVVTGEGG